MLKGSGMREQNAMKNNIKTQRLEKVNMKSEGGRTKVLGTLVAVGGAMIFKLYKGTPLTKSPAAQAMVQKRYHRNKRLAIGSVVLTAGSIMRSSWFLIQAKIGKRYPCQYSSTAIMSFSTTQSAILVLITDRNVSKWTIKGKFGITTVIYAVMIFYQMMSFKIL